MKGIGEKVGYVVSAYGCTHACNFCSINRITNNKYLVFSTEMVLKNISFFKEDVQIIRLVDANSFGNIKASRELGLEIIKAKLNKNFIADVRSDTVVENPELFGIWKQAGLSKLVIGFEDIHDANLKKLNKKNSRNNNIEAIKILKNLGIKIIGDFIISPEYEENNFIEIENFIKEYEIDVPIPTILTPLPGTALFKKLEDKIIIKNLDYYTFTNAVIETNLEQNIFYEYYAALLKKCFSNIK
ncbi:MAG: radical SAM protein [uncultured bacterium]|nr:MAG: radical SAM protein [uncultured bacterium]